MGLRVSGHVLTRRKTAHYVQLLGIINGEQHIRTFTLHPNPGIGTGGKLITQDYIERGIRRQPIGEPKERPIYFGEAFGQDYWGWIEGR